MSNLSINHWLYWEMQNLYVYYEWQEPLLHSFYATILKESFPQYTVCHSLASTGASALCPVHQILASLFSFSNELHFPNIIFQASDFSGCGVQASHCRGCSPCRAWAPDARVPAVAVHGLSCSVPCEIFLGQGSNLWTLRWQADSQSLDHQGSPRPDSCIFPYIEKH